MIILIFNKDACLRKKENEERELLLSTLLLVDNFQAVSWWLIFASCSKEQLHVSDVTKWKQFWFVFSATRDSNKIRRLNPINDANDSDYNWEQYGRSCLMMCWRRHLGRNNNLEHVLLLKETHSVTVTLTFHLS